LLAEKAGDTKSALAEEASSLAQLARRVACLSEDLIEVTRTSASGTWRTRWISVNDCLTTVASGADGVTVRLANATLQARMPRFVLGECARQCVAALRSGAEPIILEASSFEGRVLLEAVRDASAGGKQGSWTGLWRRVQQVTQLAGIDAQIEHSQRGCRVVFEVEVRGTTDPTLTSGVALVLTNDDRVREVVEEALVRQPVQVVAGADALGYLSSLQSALNAGTLAGCLVDLENPDPLTRRALQLSATQHLKSTVVVVVPAEEETEALSLSGRWIAIPKGELSAQSLLAGWQLSAGEESEPRAS